MAGSTPTYARCYGSWFDSNLRSGVDYIFSVIATDAVGNVGSVVAYSWRIGKLLLFIGIKICDNYTVAMFSYVRASTNRCSSSYL